MGKNSFLNAFGDCPDLEYGQKSTEHEARFKKQIKGGSKIMNNGTITAADSVNEQNIAIVKDSATEIQINTDYAPY